MRIVFVHSWMHVTRDFLLQVHKFCYFNYCVCHLELTKLKQMTNLCNYKKVERYLDVMRQK